MRHSENQDMPCTIAIERLVSESNRDTDREPSGKDPGSQFPETVSFSTLNFNDESL
jgi:hypothetical protein